LEIELFNEFSEYRFGLAGKGQGDIIERYLVKHRGRLLYVGCGIPDHKFQILSNLCKLVVAVDLKPGAVSYAKEKLSYLYNVKFEVADAKDVGFHADSFDHILALGLFAEIRPNEISTVFSEFWRVCRRGGHLMVTNATNHPKETYVEAGLRCGFELVTDEEGYCPAAFSKRRYLLVFAKPKAPVDVSRD
jgi:ubiquinone/menaquinone biosynthesis C-methylase UbiE